MEKVSTGIRDLDSLIDSIHVGDNMVWEMEAGTSEDVFIQNFISTSLAGNKDVIYVSFNRSPQSIMLNMKITGKADKLTILDCFTSGKGKSDRAFLKYYETQHPAAPQVIRVNRPMDISIFSETINSIQDKLSEGARYIFDSLTGMQDLWGDENSTHKFFTYMCPRLYDLGTVAYWMLEKDAHSQAFKANLRHITQVVIDLSKKKDKLFLKAVKLDGRANREAFKPHSFEIEDQHVSITPVKRETPLEIGTKIREARMKIGMSQKDLSDKIGMTSSFISQLENNQISPSLSSFLQIAEVLGLNPAALFQKSSRKDETEWLVRRKSILGNISRKEQGYTLYNILSDDKKRLYVAIINPGAELQRHFVELKKEELIYVVRGKILIRVGNKERELEQGDSVFLKDSFPSYWKNKHTEEAELLVLCG